MRAIATLQLPEGTSIAFARDVFMFSFYMRGMPFVDIAYLRKKDLKNKMLAYSRKKTNQYLTVEWVKEAQEIIDRYEQINPASPYLLPIIQQDDGTEQKQYHRMLENINYNLKKIGEMTGLKMPLTTYTARHTWASIARDMDIPIPIISEGMGQNSIKTTQVYLNSIDVSKINEVNKKIIRRISKKYLINEGLLSVFCTSKYGTCYKGTFFLAFIIILSRKSSAILRFHVEMFNKSVISTY